MSPEAPGAGPAPAAPEAPQDLFRLQGWYRTMLLARAVDELMWVVGAQGKAHFVLTSRGHEAAQVGAAAALRAGWDYVFTYYRSMAVALQLGVSAEDIFLSVLARRDDPFAGGRQLPNHISVPRLRLPTGSSSVGTHIPHATGAGYAARVLGQDFVAVAFFGDGATAKGDFHEALTIAGIWKLPVVFICENNGLAISVPTHLESPAPIHLKGAGYGMPGVLVDGCDPLAVYRAVAAAAARARAGEGPTLIEAEVVRLVAHSNADDQSVYRSADELAGARARDPLPRLRRRLVAAGTAETLLGSWEAEARASAEAALEAAERAPEPAAADARRHLYPEPAADVAGAPAAEAGA
ncbi:MAG TPA: thiamine pyrophosphate-dependent dehydrogenase E1 component subunit alpha [Chloroflexota bacterium]|nr:thiamine pyrophosphate-dependent dehydrogenase E1 component subunit alpha [Chloroflexota bacterium]